jgi:hypothetical protein
VQAQLAEAARYLVDVVHLFRAHSVHYDAGHIYIAKEFRYVHFLQPLAAQITHTDVLPNSAHARQESDMVSVETNLWTPLSSSGPTTSVFVDAKSAGMGLTARGTGNGESGDREGCPGERGPQGEWRGCLSSLV